MNAEELISEYLNEAAVLTASKIINRLLKAVAGFRKLGGPRGGIGTAKSAEALAMSDKISKVKKFLDSLGMTLKYEDVPRGRTAGEGVVLKYAGPDNTSVSVMMEIKSGKTKTFVTAYSPKKPTPVSKRLPHYD